MFDIGPNLLSFNYFTYFFIFLCGLILGSFLNSWIWRTHENIRVISSGAFSICINCRRQLLWYEKIPVFSYLFLRGQCRTCKKNIPWHYAVVELTTAFLLLWVSNHFLLQVHFSEWHFLRDVFFLTFLIIIFVYDALYQEVLLRIVWPGFFIGLLINVFALHYSLENLLLGSTIGGLFFLLQYLVSNGRWIGGGDVRLGFMIGIWLGWPNVLVAVLIAYILGAIVAVGLLLSRKKHWDSAIPFGTFLASATFIALYYGQDLVEWYLNLLR